MRLDYTNYYSAFVSLACRLLKDNGQLVSITPRSFCNGPYFKTFRNNFLNSMKLRRIHLFNSRNSSFRDDNVLQENIIICSTKEKDIPNSVVVSSSDGIQDEYLSIKEVPYASVVSLTDKEKFIHVISDEIDDIIAGRMKLLNNKLQDLGLSISTGKIVDFRAREFIMNKLDKSTPLIRPINLKKGQVIIARNTRSMLQSMMLQKKC